MALEVGIVGLPGAGKTSLFNALTRAGAQGHERKEHVGMAPIADERLAPVAAVEHAKKVTPAVIRVVDVPGTGPQLLGNLRQVDALLMVVREPGQLEELGLELLVADRDHVERRLERVRQQAKSGDPKLRKEVADLERLLAHVEAGGTVADYPDELPPELDPLTTKPVVVVENGPAGIDLKLEAELSELDEEEAAAFRDGGRSALDEVAATPEGRARPGHVLHRGREGDARLDAEAGADGARRRRDDPLRHRPRVHPLRGDPLAGPGRVRLAGRGLEARPAAAGGQGVRRRRTATCSTSGSTSSCGPQRR